MPRKLSKKPTSVRASKPAPGKKHQAVTKPSKQSQTRRSSAPAKPMIRQVPIKRTKADNSPKIGSSTTGPVHYVDPMSAKPIAPAIVPAPVPTDGKPRKNLAGITPKELEHYRELLLMKRRELVGDMSSMEREALRSTTGSNLSNLPLHMADMGTDNYEQEFTLGLVEKDRQLLREINSALAKIQDGRYGICEGTGKPINRPRLEAQPWAKYSIEYARLLERNMLRR